jgi:hypothetical protein
MKNHKEDNEMNMSNAENARSIEVVEKFKAVLPSLWKKARENTEKDKNTEGGGESSLTPDENPISF